MAFKGKTVATAESNFQQISRRRMLTTSCAFGGLFMVGCSRSPDNDGSTATSNAAQAGPAPARPTMLVHKDANCGCCQAWADIAERAGYSVSVVNEADMPAVKATLGVPDELASCHTTEVSGLVLEGHVPLEAVDRMLRQRSEGLRGIAVPGMPVGSPGMEAPDGKIQPFQIIAFYQNGQTRDFTG